MRRANHEGRVRCACLAAVETMRSNPMEVVGELSLRRPLAFAVLYGHGIDASCARCTLTSTCERRGLDPADVLVEIAAAEHALVDPWHARPLGELLDHVLRTYHRPFAAELDALQESIDTARSFADPAAWDELVRAIAELRDDMEQHMDKEERVLFPWLRVRAATAAGPVRAMQLEHVDTIALLHTVHAAAVRCFGDAPQGAAAVAAARLAKVEHWLCEHMHLEDNELFPRALEAMTAR